MLILRKILLKGVNTMEFKERVLKLIAYYLYVAESKMKVSTEEKENYSIKVALLRDIYDDIKAMDVENEVKYGRERKRTN